jgi:subtilase family serine protease
MKPKTFLLVVVASAVLFLTSSPAIAQQIIHGHMPAALTRLHLQPMGRLTSTNRLSLAIGLPLRNQRALTNFLQQLYDPTSTNYHRYLTPEQFTEKFGPTEKDYQAVIAFARKNGFEVTGTHSNRALLDVSGPVTKS